MSEQVVSAFGQVVRELRKTQHLSQETLADASSLDRTFLSQLETGRKQPSLLTIFRLATALHISASDLMRQVEERVAQR